LSESQDLVVKPTQAQYNPDMYSPVKISAMLQGLAQKLFPLTVSATPPYFQTLNKEEMRKAVIRS